LNKISNFTRFSLAAVIAVTAMCSVTLLGWLYHIPNLVHPFVGYVTMKTNTAVGLLLDAIALFFILRYQQTEEKSWAYMAALTASFCTSIGIFTLCEHAGCNIVIDEVLIRDMLSQQLTDTPGRMCANTAVSFCLISSGLLLTALNKQRFSRSAMTLSLLTCAISILTIFGYAYHVPDLYIINRCSQMAAATAVSFIALSIGLLCALPKHSFLGVLSNSTSGGFIARRLVPFALLTPPILGFLTLQGLRLGYYGTEFGLAMIILLMMLFTTLLAFWISEVVAGRDMTLNYASVLERTTDRLMQSNDELEHFYAILVHELRTPITSIRGSLILIQNGIAKGREPELLNVSLSETERMLKLINELLDLNKIEEGKCELQFAAVQPDQLVSRTINAMEGMATDLKIDLIQSVNTANTIVCDENKIIQTLANLVSNAMKFAPGSQVAITVDENSFGTRFSVIDRGPGISSDQREKLFHKFQQLEAKSSLYKGSGLGLSIAKAIVEQHGGNIGVESTLGSGSTFWFDLPAKQPQALSLTSDSSASNPQARNLLKTAAILPQFSFSFEHAAD
jgi:signal transduction histidine kinase